MKPKIIHLFLIILSISCGRPECKNTNSVFDKFTPDTKEYKTELLKQIEAADAGQLRYWFIRNFEKNEKDYIEINIQSGNICAKAEVRVDEWGNMTAIKKKKGVSYSGAELKGFEMMMVQDSSTTNLVFVDVDKISD